MAVLKLDTLRPWGVDNDFLSSSYRYRHYGVYLTHEEDQLVDGDDVLRNPVVVLDKNSESYINLRYPIHSKEESELTKGLTPKVTKTWFGINLFYVISIKPRTKTRKSGTFWKRVFNTRQCKNQTFLEIFLSFTINVLLFWIFISHDLVLFKQTHIKWL